MAEPRLKQSRFKRIGKLVLQIGLPAIILAFFFPKLIGIWKDLSAHSFQWNYWLLLLAFGGFVLQELSFGLIWRMVLKRLGQKLSFRHSLRIYLSSEFVRYIPGNVWHLLTRILWVGEYGISRPVAFASMMVELITKLASGVLIFGVSLLFWEDIGAIGKLVPGPLIVGLGLLTIVSLLVVLHPAVLNGLLNKGLKILKREPVALTLRYSDILIVTLAWCVSWIIAGAAFYILLLSIWPTTPLIALPICIGLYAIGWDIGFLSFITPSGLGFRELAIGALFALSLPLPAALGGVIALLSRVVSTAAELVCVSIAYLSGGGRKVREVQQEQEARVVGGSISD